MRAAALTLRRAATRREHHNTARRTHLLTLRHGLCAAPFASTCAKTLDDALLASYLAILQHDCYALYLIDNFLA